MRVPKSLLTLPAVLVVVVIGVVLAGCGGGGKQSVPQNAVAVVGDTIITRAAFDTQIALAKKQAEAAGGAFPSPGTAEYEAQKQQAVQTLVQQAWVDAEAAKLGVKVTDKQVDDQLEQIKQTSFGGSQAKLEQEIKKQGLTLEYVRSTLRNRAVQEQLLKKITAAVKISDDEIKTYYDGHKKDYSQPENREVAHILVKTKALAEKLRQRLQGGEDFAKLAKQYSLDPGSKATGGKLPGGDTRGTLVPPFEKAAFALATGEISQPVKTQFGWHIIKALGDTTAEHISPLKDVSNSIRTTLQQQQEADAVQKWVEDVKKKYEGKTDYQVGFAPPKADDTTTTSG